MEPFGLFQFLQSLLKTPPAQETQEEENTSETTPEPPVNTTQTPINETYFQFIANHEKRTRNIRKK